MAAYFLDTSALQHRYIPSAHSRRIRRVISDTSNQCVIAEFTVLELASAIANRCRQGQMRRERYDLADHRFWSDIAEGRLQVRSAGIRENVRARNLIRYAQLLKRRKLTSADALIAVSALELALELKEKIIFYVSDWNMFDILSNVNAFKVALSMQFIGVPKVPQKNLAKTKKSQGA
jgi:predicted nucleic acid-binding protein